MSSSAATEYRPSAIVFEVKRSARNYWRIALAMVLAWVGLILLAPVAAAAGANGISQPVYHLFGYICHQMPERSFYILGHQFAVCSRCFGVYFGLFAGMIVYPLFRRMDESDPLPRFWLFLSMVPMAIDWSLGYFRIWENNHFTRVTTGLILGVACAVFIIPALVELAEIRALRSASKAKEAAGIGSPQSN